MTEPDAPAKLRFVTCSRGWGRECSSRWAAESVAKLHPRLSPPGTEHTLTIEGPPAEARGQGELTLTPSRCLDYREGERGWEPTTKS